MSAVCTPTSAIRIDRTSAPTVVVATPDMGAPSQVWMTRQLRTMRRLNPRVLCWRRREGTELELGDVPVTVLELDWESASRAARWRRRLGTLGTGNFVGACGSELDALVHQLENEQAAAVLCHFGHTALRVLPAAKRLGLPIIAHFHGMDCSSMLRNRWYRWSLRRWIGACDAIVVVGNHQRDRLIALGAPVHAVHVIPCGVPTNEFTPRAAIERTGPYRLITVGRLVEFKGMEETIRAFARLDDPTAELIVVGDGPQRGMLDALVHELGVAQRVHFRGSQAESAVRDDLRTADVFVLHALDGADGAREGFGVAAAEASACGLPVVATRCGGLCDQVVHGETGLLVDQGDIAATTQALHELGVDPNRRMRLGAAGRRRMQTHFDTARQVRLLEEVVLDTIGDSR